MAFTKYRLNLTLYAQRNKSIKYVRIRVTSQSSRVDLYTGISLSDSQWDKRRQQVKQGCIINNVTELSQVNIHSSSD